MIDRIAGLIVVCLVTFLTVGCEPAATTDDKASEEKSGDGHEAHAEFRSLDEGVGAVQELYDSIKSKIAAEESSDDDIHKITHLLVHDIPDLLSESTLSDEDKTSAKDAIEKLMAGYEKLHDAAHHGEQPDYSAVEDSLQEAMESLKTAMGSDEV